jgi:hypothetical protein
LAWNFLAHCCDIVFTLNSQFNLHRHPVFGFSSRSLFSSKDVKNNSKDGETIFHSSLFGAFFNRAIHSLNIIQVQRKQNLKNARWKWLGNFPGGFTKLAAFVIRKLNQEASQPFDFSSLAHSARKRNHPMQVTFQLIYSV